MKKLLKWLALILATVLLAGFLGIYIWSQQTYGPSENLTALVDVTSIVDDNEDIVIYPEGAIKAGIVLYPGAKVENAAYSYYGQQLAEAGYAVFIPKLRLNFAIFDQQHAQKIIEANKEIEDWYVGGHSLGGVAAASFAKDSEYVKGLILLASYPSGSAGLADSSLHVLSLYASNDGLTKIADIEASKKLLPTSTQYVEIQGGNHAQFGLYGQQKGDLLSEISPLDQQQIMIEKTIDWLSQHGK